MATWKLIYELVSEEYKVRIHSDDLFQAKYGGKDMRGKAHVWLEHRVYKGEE